MSWQQQQTALHQAWLHDRSGMLAGIAAVVLGLPCPGLHQEAAGASRCRFLHHCVLRDPHPRRPLHENQTQEEHGVPFSLGVQHTMPFLLPCLLAVTCAVAGSCEPKKGERKDSSTLWDDPCVLAMLQQGPFCVASCYTEVNGSDRWIALSCVWLPGWQGRHRRC